MTRRYVGARDGNKGERRIPDSTRRYSRAVLLRHGRTAPHSSESPVETEGRNRCRAAASAVDCVVCQRLNEPLLHISFVPVMRSTLQVTEKQ